MWQRFCTSLLADRRANCEAINDRNSLLARFVADNDPHKWSHQAPSNNNADAISAGLTLWRPTDRARNSLYQHAMLLKRL